jgi:hypothetical protein
MNQALKTSPISNFPALPEPAGYFRKGEKLHWYQSPASGIQYESGLIHNRSSNAFRSCGSGGIFPELRRETDYRDQDGDIVFQAPFEKSDYSERLQRRRELLHLSSEASRGLLNHFKAYQTGWNQLVLLDRSGQPVRAKSGDRLTRDYLNRRKLSAHPLRTKTFCRVCSIPVTPEIKAELKKYLNLDWRYVISMRLLRRGHRVLLAVIHKETQIREVDLEKRKIRHCRDPRLCDMGICFSPNGMAVRIQNPTEDHQNYFVPVANLTKQLINQLLTQIAGKIRVVALDPICPESCRGLKTYLTRKLRTLQAEGAIEFRLPRLVSLGAKYNNLPQHHPLHLKVWQKNLIKEWFDYSQILGLTGRPLMVKPSNGTLIGADSRQVKPLTRANHVIQMALAKMDLWHGATFLRSRSWQRVRSAFYRHLCK